MAFGVRRLFTGDCRLTGGALAGVLVSLVALIAPVVLRSGIPAGHDTPAHLTYAYLFDRALVEGHFPVRWIEWVRAGHGQPLFNFYQPGLFYLVQAIHLGIPSLLISLKLAVLLAWWLGAAFVYLLVRHLGRLPAAAAALVFTFSPYVMLDVFVRAAYPELAGMSFALGVLWAIDAWLRTQRRLALLAFACLAAALVVSHPPTTLLFAPLAAAYAGYLLATQQTTARAVISLVPFGLLGAALAAFYLIPAVTELPLIRNAELRGGGYDFHRHFVVPTQWVQFSWGFGGSVEGAGDGMSFQIGIGQWIAITSAMVIVASDIARRAVTRRTTELTFWLAAAAGAMFLMTPWSAFIWEAVAPMAFVQFPWRLLMLVAVSAAALTAHLLASITREQVRAAVVLCAAVVLVQLSHTRLTPRGYITAETMDIDWWDWRDSGAAQKSAFIEHGYFPATFTGEFATGRRWTLVSGGAEVREIALKGHEVDLRVAAETPVRVRINSPAFPGWTVTIDGRPAVVLPDAGYFSVDVPPGVHRVTATFANTAVRTAANAVSLAAGAIVLYNLLYLSVTARSVSIEGNS